MSSDEQILICAVRYALGRRSYIVNVVCNHINRKRKELSEKCKAIIIRDIEEGFKLYHRLGETLGDSFDEKTWKRLLVELREVGEDE